MTASLKPATTTRTSAMPQITIGTGALLIVVSLVAWFATGMSSWTAFIPAIFGVLMIIGGVIGRSRPMIGIHAALVVAILGIIGTAMNTFKLGDVFAGTAERPGAIIASAITFVVLIVYVVLGVRSFIAARRWKTENA